MCQINLMHRVVKYRAEFHAYQENLPCTIPPCASNLSDTPNLIAYNMQIRKCHLIFITVYSEPYYSIIQQGTLAVHGRFNAKLSLLIRIYGTVVNFNYTHSNANSLATSVVAIYTTRAFCHRRQ